jgi:hypothetical protein
MWVISAVFALASCPPGASATSCQSNSAWLYLPVLGPFLAAAETNATFGGRNLAIVDGVIQTAAFVTLIAGVATSHSVLVRDATATAERSRRTDWHFVPAAPGASVGASVSITHF